MLHVTILLHYFIVYYFVKMNLAYKNIIDDVKYDKLDSFINENELRFSSNDFIEDNFIIKYRSLMIYDVMKNWKSIIDNNGGYEKFAESIQDDKEREKFLDKYNFINKVSFQDIKLGSHDFIQAMSEQDKELLKSNIFISIFDVPSYNSLQSICAQYYTYDPCFNIKPILFLDLIHSIISAINIVFILFMILKYYAGIVRYSLNDIADRMAVIRNEQEEQNNQIR